MQCHVMSYEVLFYSLDRIFTNLQHTTLHCTITKPHCTTFPCLLSVCETSKRFVPHPIGQTWLLRIALHLFPAIPWAHNIQHANVVNSMMCDIRTSSLCDYHIPPHTPRAVLVPSDSNGPIYFLSSRIGCSRWALPARYVPWISFIVCLSSLLQLDSR